MNTETMVEDDYYVINKIKPTKQIESLGGIYDFTNYLKDPNVRIF